MITVHYISGTIELIRTLDDEAAHEREDALHKEVLKAIASGELLNNGALAMELAKEALKSQELNFGRWCA